MPDSAVARDIMGPDSEPTDEELELVMTEARDVARARWAAARVLLQQRIDDAVREARSRPHPEPK